MNIEVIQMMDDVLGFAKTNEINAIVLAIAAVIGAVILFYGYRLVRALIFVIGFIATSWILSYFIDKPIAIITGLIVGAVLVVFWYLGVFAIGAVLGIVAAALCDVNDRTVALICGTIGGILAVIIRKFFIIVSTSFSGGSMVASALTSALAALLGNVQQVVTLVLTLVLAIIGICFQYKKSPSKKIPAKAQSPAKPPPPASSAPTIEPPPTDAPELFEQKEQNDQQKPHSDENLNRCG